MTCYLGEDRQLNQLRLFLLLQKVAFFLQFTTSTRACSTISACELSQAQTLLVPRFTNLNRQRRLDAKLVGRRTLVAGAEHVI